MIIKINKIKNLGIFSNYQEDVSLPEFKRFNVVYGWNGSGKTTLTELFTYLSNNGSTKHPNLEYNLETTTAKYTQADEFPIKIRIFNQEFVAKNVQLSECTANPIYILGEENKKLLDLIKADEDSLIKLKGDLKAAVKIRDKEVVAKDKVFTDIARTISTNTSGEATRKYDKRNAETEFKNITDNKVLTETEISKYRLSLKQLEKPLIQSIEKPCLKDNDKVKTIDASINDIIEKAKILLATTVKIKLLERLKNNNDISVWVESGIALHNKHNSEYCEYCKQKMPDSRKQELSQHFNDEDKNLKNSIVTVVDEITQAENALKSNTIPDKANLYEELQKDYHDYKNKIDIENKAILKQLADLKTVLEDKKSKTTENIELNITINTQYLNDFIDRANEIIQKHNDKTLNFSSEKNIAQKSLETHYLKSIFDEIKDSETSLSTSNTEIESLKGQIDSLAKTIETNKGKTTSPQNACNELNEKVKTFLGREDIKFEVEGEGYLIKRNGEIAKYLSEGEKTALAFAYFTVQLKDKDFDITKGIVIIDDPISSLDSNSMFQAFSFLKSSVKEAMQVFILTHNFEFLRLLLNWLNHIGNDKEYFMIKNKDLGGRREAFLDELDRDLRKHESEYHYLFGLLNGFKSDGTIASVYHIPNIARKVLDTFLMFRVPSSETTYKKLESLKNDFDEIKITSIYKFTNDASHITGSGFDPSLVPETQKNVKYLLELIETTFPEHYKILITSLN